MTKKKYGFWDIAGDLTGALLAVPTYGASLTLSPTARGLVGNVLGGGSNENDNNTQQLLEQQKLQNEQFNVMMKQNREELEKIRKKEKIKKRRLRTMKKN